MYQKIEDEKTGRTWTFFHNYGDLHDYNTGEWIRCATREERDASRNAGHEGVILVNGRSVYVEE